MKDSFRAIRPWPRTNLDELARLFHAGVEGFWAEWREFTGTATPVVVLKDPRLYLVARTFHERTHEALQFLIQYRLPVQVLKIAFYVDEGNRRFLDVEWAEEPEASPVPAAAPPEARDGVAEEELVDTDRRDFREVTLAEVAASVETPAPLVWVRPRKGERDEATLRPSVRSG